MPAISGSQKALMESRSNLGRAGATRAGYYTPTVLITIGGVSRTSSVIQDSLRVSLALNDEPDTARFRMKPGSTIPTPGQPVIIALGQIDNRIFAGSVARPKHIRREGNLGNPFADVECVDWAPLFDRRLLVKTYTAMSASDIALDIIDTYTDGFTTARIELGLPTIDSFVCINERPSAAFTRLVTLMGGGGWYIDPDRAVHLFGTAGDASASLPQTLVNSLSTLKAFTHEYDNRQIRNRVFAEGRQTTCPIAVPVGATSFPITDALAILPGVADGLRLGTERITYSSPSINSPESYASLGIIGQSTTVYEAANATAGSVKVENGSLSFATPGWAKVNGTYFHYTTIDATGGGSGLFTYLIGVADAGAYGQLLVNIEPGDVLTLSDHVYGVPASGAGSLQVAQAKDQDVVLFMQEDDTAAQTALAAIEGGDGIHEHVVTAPDLDIAALTGLAEAELEAFAAETGIPRIDWVTTDLNAKPGVSQVVNLTTTDAFAVTLTITSVDLSFPKQRYPPFRRCQAADVKRPQLVDVLAQQGS